jgi:Protein of unknown function (DUF4089)
MKSKKRKKLKFAPSKKRSKRLSRARTESNETKFVAAAAPALRLQVDPAWEASVTFNLQLLMRHAALVNEFALPDEAEPAPVFRA